MTNTAAPCVWTYWRIPWQFLVDTATVWAASMSAGIRTREHHINVHSADRPSAQSLHSTEVQSLLSLWRNWGHKSLLKVLRDLERLRVISVLEKASKLSSLAWSVEHLTVNYMYSRTIMFLLWGNTCWWKRPPYQFAPNTTSSWRSTVEQTRPVSAHTA